MSKYMVRQIKEAIDIIEDTLGGDYKLTINELDTALEKLNDETFAYREYFKLQLQTDYVKEVLSRMEKHYGIK